MRKVRSSYQIISLITVALLLLAWYLVTNNAMISPLLLPSPQRVGEALYALHSTILAHTLATMSRVLAGFFIGIVVGILVGSAMNWNPVIFAVLDPIVESLRPVPPIAILPFFILWFGLGPLGQILLITISCAVVLAVNTFVALQNIPPVYLKAARSLGAKNHNIYLNIALPAILPYLVAGFRISAALAFTVTIAAEFMGAQQGLGFVIMRARRTLETQTIFLAVLAIGIMSFAMDKMIRKISRYLTRWTTTDSEGFLP